MSRHLIALVVTAAICAVAGPAFAHHGTAAFDLSQQITVKGTVTEFVFANPHSLVHFDVKNDKGEVERWMAELRVPVVIEIMLERVTNIAMGTEIDKIVEFEELAVGPEDAPSAVGLLD